MAKKPGRPINMELPIHPAIGNECRIEKRYEKLTAVTDVTCPSCGSVRSVSLQMLRTQIKTSRFTGNCRKCQSTLNRHLSSGGGRPIDLTPLDSHPAVSDQYRIEERYGRQTAVTNVTCPSCADVRVYPLYILRQQMLSQLFTGQCRKCGQKASRPAATKSIRKRYSTIDNRRSKNNYVMINASKISKEDRPMFDAMRGKALQISEHRWNMAKYLGRPLSSWELVDHMDGNKGNNDPRTNLRLYIKGKNQPGSAPGYGTYYHEWQFAEARIRVLEREFNARGKRIPTSLMHNASPSPETAQP